MKNINFLDNSVSSEVFWLDLLKPGHIHQTATSDVGLGGVDHLREDHNLGFLVEENRLGVDVALLPAVQRHVVALRGALGHVDEEPPGQGLPHCIHVPGGVQPDPAVMAELHQLSPHLQSELQMSVDEEMLLAPVSRLVARLERSPHVQQCDQVTLVSRKFLKKFSLTQTFN